MKLKLKQSNSNSKHLVFPLLSHPYQHSYHRYTPRAKIVNQSLPKIPQSFLGSQPNIPNQHSRLRTEDNSVLRQKIKSGYHRGKKLVTPSPSLKESYPNKNADEGNVTQNFKKQIQKNLVFIKKEKENRKKSVITGKIRYNVLRHDTIQNDNFQDIPSHPPKCLTEEDDVFSKINQIIIKSQSNPSPVIDQTRHISYSSYIAKDKFRALSDSLEQKRVLSKRHLKTEGNNNNSLREDSKSIKNVGNYHQWRKLSIDSEDQRKISYNISSYEHENDRIEKIRNKNEQSLKKYIQGKSYLSKLINYRDSSTILPQEK